MSSEPLSQQDLIRKLVLATSPVPSSEAPNSDENISFFERVRKVPLEQILQSIITNHQQLRFSHGWDTQRTMREVLEGKGQGNYSQLGEFHGQTAFDYLQSLPQEDINFLEFAVGAGNFLRQIKNWQPQWNVIGMDVFRQQENYPFPFIQTNIDFILHPETLAQLQEHNRFDVVTCTALFHHLQHQLLDIGNLSELVKPGGRLYVSSLPRTIRPTKNGVGPALDDKYGSPLPQILDRTTIQYARNMISPRSMTGEIVFPEELWNLMNQWNRGRWEIQYEVGNYDQNPDGQNYNRPEFCCSGRIVASRLSNQSLLLHWLFYAHVGEKNDWILLVAGNESERQHLNQQFVSVSDVQNGLSQLEVNIQYDPNIYNTDF